MQMTTGGKPADGVNCTHSNRERRCHLIRSNEQKFPVPQVHSGLVYSSAKNFLNAKKLAKTIFWEAHKKILEQNYRDRHKIAEQNGTAEMAITSATSLALYPSEEDGKGLSFYVSSNHTHLAMSRPLLKMHRHTHPCAFC